MGSDSLDVEGISFPTTISPPASSTTLTLIGHGLTEMSIETIEIKFTAIGVYLEPTVGEHLQQWKGKAATELAEEDSGFHKAVQQAEVEKLIKVGIIKGVKGTPYGGSLQSSVRDKLVYDDKYEEPEETALEDLVTFFQPHNFPKGSAIFYYWPTASKVQVSISADGSVPDKVLHTIDNNNVAEALLDLYLGENTITPTTVTSVAEGISALL